MVTNKIFVKPVLKLMSLMAVAAVVLTIAWLSYRSGILDPGIIDEYRDSHPIMSVMLFLAFYVASVLFMLPTLPLNLASGFFWGGLLGGIYSTVGVTVGGWLSFELARWFVGMPLAKKFESSWISRVQEGFERDGWKFVVFIRINPVIPPGPLSYLLGLTQLSRYTFIAVTFICILPPATGVAYFGDTFHSFNLSAENHTLLVWDILIFSGILSVVWAARWFMTLRR